MRHRAPRTNVAQDRANLCFSQKQLEATAPCRKRCMFRILADQAFYTSNFYVTNIFESADGTANEM